MRTILLPRKNDRCWEGQARGVCGARNVALYEATENGPIGFREESWFSHRRAKRPPSLGAHEDGEFTGIRMNVSGVTADVMEPRKKCAPSTPPPRLLQSSLL